MVIQGNQITQKTQEDSSEEDDDQEERTMAEIQKDSISGLIMNFQKPKPRDKTQQKRKPPPLPPRDEISEDSLEDELTEEEEEI